MATSVRIALRDWDWVTPLVLGELDQALAAADVRLDISRVSTLPDLYTTSEFDAAELSQSRYLRGVAAGRQGVLAVPHWLMQAPRHRCVIVRTDSPHHRFADLAGGTIGLTGWQDSGNTWTRAVLGQSGVPIDDARWVVGRLTADHPITDRLDGFGRRGHIVADPQERPLTQLLAAGELDAVLTPFMPPDYFAANAPYRPLLADVQGEETRWIGEHGYVPGIHLLGFRRELIDRNPELAAAVSTALAASRESWLGRRRRYAETSTWLLEDLRREAAALPVGWNTPGLERNRPMVQDFIAHAVAQGLLSDPPTVDELFPLDVGPDTGRPNVGSDTGDHHLDSQREEIRR